MSNGQGEVRLSATISVVMLIVFFALTFFVSFLGAMANAVSIDSWYPVIAKSPLTPPGWVFPVVWTALYAMMALAAWLVWRKAGGMLNAPMAFLLFFAQLGLNLLWSVLFFGNCNPAAALIEITLLWVMILATTFAFAKHSRLAVWLLVPYLLWVGFAAYLNYAVVRLNPDLIGGCF